MAAVVRASLRLLQSAPELRKRLWRRIRIAERIFEPLGATVTGTQILPIIVGDAARTMDLATKIKAAGFDVRGIRPPTVPAGTSRLRITITNNASEAQMTALGALLATLPLSA
jgi:8-amino-7-oxononanoate synthase